MATIELASASAKKVWTAKRYDEYVRGSGFKPFMGTSNDKIIHVRQELRNEAGDTVNIPLLAKLGGNGKRGATPIAGNEQGLANYNFPISIDFVGDGVAVSNYDQFRTEIDLLDAGKSALVQLMAEITRNDIIKALGSKGGAQDTVENPLAAAARNAWTVTNKDRVLFGNSASNYNATFATALASVDSTSDKLSKKVVKLARMLARNAKPLIRPAMVKEIEMSGKGGNMVECFVMFVGARSFYHLGNDPELVADLRQGMERGVLNPLFQPGDYMIDNVIIREIPEITELLLLSGAGASSVDVEPYFFCGAQAIGYAVGNDPKFATDARDYGFVNGVAVRELRGIEKNRFQPSKDNGQAKDHGVFTGFVAAPNE